MTLGEPIKEETAQATWSTDVDDDVLAAYLAARARA